MSGQFIGDSIKTVSLLPKKNRMMTLVKLMMIGKILKAKFDMMLKLYTAGIQTKIFFVLLSILALQKIKFFMDLKKHEPHKAIYYEHAQHDHHYDDASWGHEEGWWGR